MGSQIKLFNLIRLELRLGRIKEHYLGKLILGFSGILFLIGGVGLPKKNLASLGSIILKERGVKKFQKGVKRKGLVHFFHNG